MKADGQLLPSLGVLYGPITRSKLSQPCFYSLFLSRSKARLVFGRRIIGLFSRTFCLWKPLSGLGFCFKGGQISWVYLGLSLMAILWSGLEMQLACPWNLQASVYGCSDPLDSLGFRIPTARLHCPSS